MVKRDLNKKLLIGLLAGAVLLAVVIEGVHRWQVKRLAARLLDQASTAEASDQLEQAADLLKRYLFFRTNDGAALLRYAHALDSTATLPGTVCA